MRGCFNTAPFVPSFAPIGERAGQYQGMPQHIQFRVVWVSAGHGAGESVVDTPDRTIDYRGASVSVKQR